VFPFRIYGVGKPDLQAGLETYARRRESRGGWHQDPIFAAMLGVTEDAQRDVTDYFNVKDLITGTSNTAFRFPAMWGPNHDWVPDQDHGGVAMTALQRMLVHYEDRRIILFPAWPEEWDVSFKLHLPHRTTVQGEFRDGEVRRLRVDPPERARDIEFANFSGPTAVNAVEERALPGRFELAVVADDLFGAGTHEAHWDGTDDYGREAGSGVYLYRLVAGEHSQTRKLVLLK
jgi:hypothetical protein